MLFVTGGGIYSNRNTEGLSLNIPEVANDKGQQLSLTSVIDYER